MSSLRGGGLGGGRGLLDAPGAGGRAGLMGNESSGLRLLENRLLGGGRGLGGRMGDPNHQDPYRQGSYQRNSYRQDLYHSDAYHQDPSRQGQYSRDSYQQHADRQHDAYPGQSYNSSGPGQGLAGNNGPNANPGFGGGRPGANARPLGLVKRVMQKDVLYLMIANLPTDAEIAEARDKMAQGKI